MQQADRAPATSRYTPLSRGSTARHIVLAGLLLVLFAAGNAQRLEPSTIPAAPPSWMQHLVPHETVVLRDLPDGATVTIRAVHGQGVVTDLTTPISSGADTIVEVATFLIEVYNRPCGGAPSLYTATRPLDRSTGNQRERTTCLPTTPRNIISIPLPLDSLHDTEIPLDTWIPLLALEAVPTEPPLIYPDALIVFYVLISTNDTTPDLPTLTAPGTVHELLDAISD